MPRPSHEQLLERSFKLCRDYGGVADNGGLADSWIAIAAHSLLSGHVVRQGCSDGSGRMSYTLPS